MIDFVGNTTLNSSGTAPSCGEHRLVKMAW
jgi:hypothetical protein